MTIDFMLHDSAKRFSLKTAVVAGGQDLNFLQLDRFASKLARALLAHGIRAGERIGVILPNSLEMVVVFFAISRCGAVIVPMNPAYTDNEIGYILEDAAVRSVICTHTHVERIHELMKNIKVRDVIEFSSMEMLAAFAEGETDSPVLGPVEANLHSILYTSGTTGRPKGAMMSHQSRVHNSMACQMGYGFSANSIVNCAPPLFHSGAMVLGMVSVLAAGGTLLIPSDAGPDATRHALVEQNANWFLSVPTIIRRLLDDTRFVEAARVRNFTIGHGASGMPISTAELMLSTWPLCRPVHAYGTTEAPQLTVLPPEEYAKHLGATGRPLPGIFVQVCRADGTPTAPGEIGEITTAGPHVMDGYLNQPEATAKVLRDGRYWTGDLARVDDCGIITIEGRSSELIITGGLNVYAKEVEDVLHAVEGVIQAAVFGVPHEEWGEIVVAAVVRSNLTLTTERLIDLCREKLASYKKPRQIHFIDEMPMTPAGKVQKFRLVERLFSRPL